MIEMPFEIPENADAPNPRLQFKSGHSLVFVGANGTGKTRLAVLMENQLQEQAHRISAHRALLLNAAVPKTSEAEALRGLRFGYSGEESTAKHRNGHRWSGGKFETALLNDFDYLLQALFGEQSRTEHETHLRHHAGTLDEKIFTKFQKLKAIWDQLLPHRALLIGGDDIKVSAPPLPAAEQQPDGGEAPGVAPAWQPYSAAEMSDGERAMFYLIGQVMVVADDSVLIVDEPELHLHRAVLGKLWDSLEAARPDCCFVYITHDLDFAANRKAAKYVIQSFHPHGPTWSLAPVNEEEGFSEELTTLLLGSRHPVLFIEGDLGKFDLATYRAIYPTWTVIPRGSCENVIHSVKTFNASTQFTRIHCAGLVDADGRDATSVAGLNETGVHVMGVEEIENMFLLPAPLAEIATLEKFDGADAAARIAAVHEEMFKTYGTPEHIEKAAVRFALRQLDQRLKRLSLDKPTEIAGLGGKFNEKIQTIDIENLAESRRADLQAAVDAKDVPKFLAMMDNKGLLTLVATRMKKTSLTNFHEWLMRTLRHQDGAGLVAALRASLPELQ